MDIKIIYFLCEVILLVFDEFKESSASDTSSAEHNASKINYAENTPFVDEAAMKAFLRADLENANDSTEILKEILYLAHNPNKITVRVFGDVPFDVFQSQLRGLFDDTELSVITPNNVEIPFGDFKRLLEQIALGSGRTKFHKELIGAVKSRLKDMTSGDTILGCFRDKAVVVVPKLFRGDFSLIGPVLDLYFPELADVSVVKVGDKFVRYDVFKEFTNYESEPVLLEDLQDIPMPEGNVSFKSLHLMMISLNNNESLLIVPNLSANSTLAGKASPLINWMAVFDVLNTNVDEYLNQVSGSNQTSIYESLPWIGSRNETIGVALMPVPDLESSMRIPNGQNITESDIERQFDAPKSTDGSTSEDLSPTAEEKNAMEDSTARNVTECGNKSTNESTSADFSPIIEEEGSTDDSTDQSVMAVEPVARDDLLTSTFNRIDPQNATTDEPVNTIEVENTTNSSNYDALLLMSRPSWDIRSKSAKPADPNYPLLDNVTETAELRDSVGLYAPKSYTWPRSVFHLGNQTKWRYQNVTLVGDELIFRLHVLASPIPNPSTDAVLGNAIAAPTTGDYAENNSFVGPDSPFAPALPNPLTVNDPVLQNQSQVLSCVVFCVDCNVTKNMTFYPPIPCSVRDNEKDVTTQPSIVALPTITPALRPRMEDEEIVNSAVWRRFSPGQTSIPKLHANFVDSPEKSINMKTESKVHDLNRGNKLRRYIDQLIKESKKRDTLVQRNRKMNKNTKNSDTVLSRHQPGKSNRHEHPDTKAMMSML